MGAELIQAFEFDQRGRARPRPGTPRPGAPAIAALARGQAVRLDRVDTKRPGLLKWDPFIEALSRTAPGRALAVDITWAAHKAPALPGPQELRMDQVVFQIYGARRWTVCSAWASSKNQAAFPRVPQGSIVNTSKLQGSCASVTLRRGDMIYIPARARHWTSAGPGSSAHLAFGVVPMVLADYLTTAGFQSHIATLAGSPLLGAPLPLWRHRNIEGATQDVAEMCSKLPWPNRSVDAAALACGNSGVRLVLQRVARRSQPPSDPSGERKEAIKSSAAEMAARREYRREKRKKTRWALVSSYMMQGLLGLCVVLVVAWLACLCCRPMTDAEKAEAEKMKQARVKRNLEKQWARAARAHKAKKD